MRPSIQAVAASIVALAALHAGGSAARAQELPEPPERYAALDPWFEGQIVEILEGGGVIKVEAVRMTTDFEELILGDGGMNRGAWIELRYARGWVFFDDPEGGPQRRRNLREGRERLEVGQMIAIGREPREGGGWESASIRITDRTTLSAGRQIRLRGWILARVTPFREER